MSCSNCNRGYGRAKWLGYNFPNIDWSLVAGDNSHTQAFVETMQDKFCTRMLVVL